MFDNFLLGLFSQATTFVKACLVVAHLLLVIAGTTAAGGTVCGQVTGRVAIVV